LEILVLFSSHPCWRNVRVGEGEGRRREWGDNF